MDTIDDIEADARLSQSIYGEDSAEYKAIDAVNRLTLSLNDIRNTDPELFDEIATVCDNARGEI